jgi:hypothetical protein
MKSCQLVSQPARTFLLFLLSPTSLLQITENSCIRKLGGTRRSIYAVVGLQPKIPICYQTSDQQLN